MPDTTKVIFAGENLSYRIGNQCLLNDAAISVHDEERVGLVGRNGSGKSTLLKILAGREQPQSGQTAFARNLRVAFMPQEFSIDENLSVYDNVKLGLHYFQDLLNQYETLPAHSAEHDKIEAAIKHYNAWNLQHKIATVIEKLNLPDQNRICTSLSGGEKRRVAFAQSVIG